MSTVSTKIFIDVFILIPLASIVETIVLIIWFYKLYSDARGVNEQKLVEMARARSTSSITTNNNTAEMSSNMSSNESTKEQPISIDSKSNPMPATSPDIIVAKSNTQISKTDDTTIYGSSSNKNKIKAHKSRSHSESTEGSLAKLKPIQKWLASISFICAFMFSWGTIAYVIIGTLFPDLTKKDHCMLHSSTLLMAVWQRFTLYTYFMVRTYVIFKGSVHQISYNKIKCYCMTLGILYIISSISFCVTGYVDGCGSGMNLLIGTCNFLLEMVFATICLKMSVNRLIKLYYSSKKMIKEKDKRAEKHLEKLMNVSTKVTVLTLAAVISTICNIMFFAPQMLLSGTVIDTVFNTICLLLSFVVFDRQYKFLCKCCDLCMLNCCKKHSQCVKGCCCVTV
eukprot:485554_1